MHRRTPLLRLAATRLAVGTLAALLGTAACAKDQPPPKVVQAPHYGDGVFYFFQDRYFTSLTTLMVSQHFERVTHHEDEAEILRGGMLLSYGLHREAGRIFEQLIERGAQPAVRDRAWYYLAKIRYQRGFIDDAQQALDRVEKHLPPELEEDRVLLGAYLKMARADHAGAAEMLRGASQRREGSEYARYNLGVALIKGGDAAAGSAWLDALGKAPARDEEMRSLRDRANVALGFAALQDNRPQQARTYLERVRLNSVQANKALLGFGWAAAAMDEPKLALVPWTELAGRDGSDAAVLEARIAVPYAYAELGAYGQALQRYHEAIAAYEHESAALDESIAAIRSGKLVDGLMEHNPGEEMGWFWSLRELPEMPHAGHLAQVLAQHDFQEAFKNYRDLQFLANNLQSWQDNLGVFHDMLEHRSRAYAERLPQILARAQQTGNGLQALQQRHDELAAALQQAETTADGRALADARQRELLARLQRVRATLDRLATEPEAQPARERYRLAAGVLDWELAQEFTPRLWAARKAFREIAAQVEQAREREAALAQAQRDEPQRFAEFAARIPTLDARIRALAPRVLALTQEQQQVVEGLAVAELARQKDRLAAYATQARFAVAQLYDHAKLKQEGDHAAGK
ncbi:tetratricopeptide repeat protein [Schlegelella sp. S2-27]|uniref:Tetratricopeptide repeat protein n=1 Tax=Caldimonas mangrovi TaxID=2944811 RepID=A0ABT0YMD6_9BURK|nr:tetratricopeptide repeat protein [Caldimonas mangrovi]MCM5679897.1 tetratricopeptide repeat protein [Caldimonas mangrovi]